MPPMIVPSDKMSVYDFGAQLLETNDLDPVYVVLYHSGFEAPAMRRFLLAYWCFYHLGTAGWILDQWQPKVFRLESKYWQAMETAAGSKAYPRSAERRHFRGQNAAKSVAWLKEKGVDPLFAFFDKFTEIPVGAVMEWVQTWRGFGPWIAFKVADMLERLGLTSVCFNDSSMFLFDSPKEGAEIVWHNYSVGDVGEPHLWAVEHLTKHFENHLAPPDYSRVVNAQEVETILCKWKSYLKGHYHIGEDVAACHKALNKFPGSKTATRLLEAGQRGGLWPQ